MNDKLVLGILRVGCLLLPASISGAASSMVVAAGGIGVRGVRWLAGPTTLRMRQAWSLRDPVFRDRSPLIWSQTVKFIATGMRRVSVSVMTFERSPWWLPGATAAGPAIGFPARLPVTDSGTVPE
jgi:hypothetical protein